MEPVRAKCGYHGCLPLDPPEMQLLGLRALGVDGFRQKDKSWDGG